MRDNVLYGLGGAAVLLLARNIHAIAGLPQEASQGAVFKIVFFHLPAVIAAAICAVAAFVASVTFLFTRNFKYDAAAVSVTEVGLTFLAANLATGMIWGRVVWGVWWAWEAPLTSALVCWLLYAGYLMLRHAIEEPTERATSAAVFSIFAFIDVPIVIFAVEWWRAKHRQPAFLGGAAFPPEWTALLGWNLLAMVLLGIVISAVRVRQEESQRELDHLRRMAHVL